ncbi:MAG TPA: hypothetical protein VFV94_02160 [Polyangiaceae bacterium]|nr:hypothetical protein [Polyangiaceae bacterium]
MTIAGRILPREHVLLSVAYLVVRLLLAACGLRYDFDLNWMFLSDPVDLVGRPFDCVYYFHAYPPGMNVLASMALLLGGSHAWLVAELAFWSLGLVLVNSLLYLARAVGVRGRPAFGLALVFSIVPQSIYLEHVFLYEHLVAALLTLAGALLHAAVKRPRSRALLGFFAACAVIGWFRSSFHLVWFAGMLALALHFVPGTSRRPVLVAAAPAALLLLSLYLKNWALFGVFGATSAAGGNLTHVTVDRLTPEARAAWIAEGKLSPLAGLHVYSGPAAYLPYFPAREDGRSPVLDRLERPTFHSPNFNHPLMIDVMKRRRDDALAYLALRPRAYASTVLLGLEQFFGPTTEWHPHDKRPDSPHANHDRVVGAYADFYNGAVHRLFAKPVGLYVFLPLFLVLPLARLRATVRSRVRHLRARAAVLAFALVQLGYVALTSALFTIGESARYRYQVEPLIWLLVAAAIHEWRRRVRRRRLLAATAPSP